MGQVETFTHDSVGNMLTRRDFNGKTTTYGYDSRNRLLSKTPDPTLSGQTPVVFTYNGTGTRATMADAGGSTTYSYDNRNRLLTKATPQGTLTYTYLANGLVASVVSSNANGASVAYGYDSLNRLATVTDNRITPGVTTYTYNDVGGVVTVTYPNSVVHTYNYDVTDRVTSVPVTHGGTTLASYTHTFNFAGHKLTATEYSGRVAAYTYDAVYKLATETVTNDPPNNGGLTYAHDAVGNRLGLTSTLSAIPSATYSYDPNDRLNADTYDANGNTLTSAGVTYGYDFEDRMTSAGAVTMIYDGDGNRVSKTASGVTTRYLVDDLTPTGYAQVAEELVGGAITVRYTHGLQRISQTRSGVTLFYGYDGGGSVRQLTDTAGAVTDTYTYDAFGVLISGTGSTLNSYRYRGEQLDASVGMYYLRARWYDAAKGRFWTADDWQGETARPASLHRYQYSHGDPIDFLDRSGFATTVERALQLGLSLAVTGLVEQELGKHGICRNIQCVWEKVDDELLIALLVSHLAGGNDVPPFPFLPNGKLANTEPTECRIWKCIVHCHLKRGIANIPSRAKGGKWPSLGVGANPNEACKNAEKRLNDSLPPASGIHPRHCDTDQRTRIVWRNWNDLR